jgi:hypothetical protein
MSTKHNTRATAGMAQARRWFRQKMKAKKSD